MISIKEFSNKILKIIRTDKRVHDYNIYLTNLDIPEFNDESELSSLTSAKKTSNDDKPDCDFTSSPVAKKTGAFKSCIFLLADSPSDSNSKYISIQDYYKKYQSTVSNKENSKKECEIINLISGEIISEILKNDNDDLLTDEDISGMHDFILDNVYLAVAPTETIQEPWVIRKKISDKSDKSIYYYWDDGLDGMYDTRISYNDLETYNITEEELHLAAIRNTKNK